LVIARVEVGRQVEVTFTTFNVEAKELLSIDFEQIVTTFRDLKIKDEQFRINTSTFLIVRPAMTKSGENVDPPLT